jgi:hypothetical protein
MQSYRLGACPCTALNTRSRILNFTRLALGSQCNWRNTGAMWSNLAVRVRDYPCHLSPLKSPLKSWVRYPGRPFLPIPWPCVDAQLSIQYCTEGPIIPRNLYVSQWPWSLLRLGSRATEPWHVRLVKKSIYHPNLATYHVTTDLRFRPLRAPTGARLSKMCHSPYTTQWWW